MATTKSKAQSTPTKTNWVLLRLGCGLVDARKIFKNKTREEAVAEIAKEDAERRYNKGDYVLLEVFALGELI